MKLVQKRSRLHCRKVNFVFVILAGLGWLSFGYIILFVDPAIWENIYYIPFFLVLCLSIAFSVKIFTSNLAVTILVPMGTISILLVRFFGFKDLINSILIVLLDLALIYFFTVQDKHDTVKQNLNNQTSLEKNYNADIETQTTS